MTERPETDAPEAPPRPGLRLHSRETWDRARDDYLAGLSGPAVCARYGLGLAAFRKRAANGGWRRIDQPQPQPAMPIEIDGDLEEASYFDLAEMAAIHLRDAIVNGRSTEAATWLRIHLRLHQAHDFEAYYAPDPRDDAVDEVDDLDGVFSAPESTARCGGER